VWRPALPNEVGAVMRKLNEHISKSAALEAEGHCLANVTGAKIPARPERHLAALNRPPALRAGVSWSAS